MNTMMNTIKVITRQTQAEEATERWKDQYKKWATNYDDNIWYDKEKEDIYNKLVSLGPNPNPDDIDNIIGNNNWTFVRCDFCREYKKLSVELNMEDNYNNITLAPVSLCSECIRDMVKELENHSMGKDYNNG